MKNTGLFIMTLSNNEKCAVLQTLQRKEKAKADLHIRSCKMSPLFH